MLSLSLCRVKIIICPAIFQTWKKSGNWRLRLEKWLKVLSFFEAASSAFKWNFVHFGQISDWFLPVCVQRIMKKLCSWVFLRSLLITYPITLVWKKKLLFIILMEKSLEKVLNSGAKYLYECCLCEEARSALRTKNILHDAICNNPVFKVNAVSQSKPHNSDYQYVLKKQWSIIYFETGWNEGMDVSYFLQLSPSRSQSSHSSCWF